MLIHDFCIMWWLLKGPVFFTCSAMSNAQTTGFFPAECNAGWELLKELFCFFQPGFNLFTALEQPKPPSQVYKTDGFGGRDIVSFLKIILED